MESGAVITVDERGALVRLSGPLSSEAMGRFVDALEAHPGFSPSVATVWDFTDTAGLSRLTGAELRAGGERIMLLREGGGRPRVALVTPLDADFGVARMFEGLTARSLEVDIRVFRALDEATGWAFAEDPGDAAAIA